MKKLLTLTLVALSSVALAYTPVLTQPTEADKARFLVAEGTMNARDLGGYATPNGKTQFGRFFRAENLNAITDAGKQTLLDKGLKTVIDLRTEDEANKSADKFATDPRVFYKRISLIPSVSNASMPATLGELYLQTAEGSKAQFKEIFELMAAHPEGAVLFHCTAGKDRTGMISALLLELAGVNQDDITHNYAVSYAYLQPMMAPLLKTTGVPVALLGTDPIEIQMFMHHIDVKYGGAQEYMKAIGLSDATIAELKKRLMA